MAALALGSPPDIAYLLASGVHSSRRVRFVRSPATAARLTTLAGYVDATSVTPVVEVVYPLDNCAAAHRDQEKGGGFGTRVIQIA
ncbi:MAG TPA: zinc-binding dehydrogenase [Rugosimonospora sp.]|nr:zinc-binding dehydrogenase [Rugosimonospora sp.]